MHILFSKGDDAFISAKSKPQGHAGASRASVYTTRNFEVNREQNWALDPVVRVFDWLHVRAKPGGGALT